MLIELNDGHKVELWDSLAIPCVLENEMNGYLMQEVGIGSEPNAVLSHIRQAITMFDKNPQGAKVEIENAYYAYHNVVDGYNVKQLAWACLVKSIDGVLVTDKGEDNLKAIVATLSSYGLTNQIISETLDEVKKKLIGRIDSISPNVENEELTLFSDIDNW